MPQAQLRALPEPRPPSRTSLGRAGISRRTGLGSVRGSGSVNRGSAGAQPGPPPAAGPRGPAAADRGVRHPQLPPDLRIAGALRSWLACAHCAGLTVPGGPGRGCPISAADPSRIAALCSVET